MDVSFSNVLEGTRQYFMGVPKPANGEARASSSGLRRPPSEPLEPEPHFIHKATVMREAAEKRRELPPSPSPPPPAPPDSSAKDGYRHRYDPPPPQPPQPPYVRPPHNDRVPPIHHPPYSVPVRREPSPYAPYEAVPRKFDPQHAYSGYRPPRASPLAIASHRVDTHHHHLQYRLASAESPSPMYASKPMPRTERCPPSSSNVRYAPAAPAQPPSKLPYRATPASRPVESAPPVVSRSIPKPGPAAPPTRMTVSVTTLVNQMNQTKQKRESPLDLSVKTVKNSADSSTAQDDAVDSASGEPKPVTLQLRPSSSRLAPSAPPPERPFVASHKVDFAPDFRHYRERSVPVPYPATAPTSRPPVRYDPGYDPATRPTLDRFPPDSRHHHYPDRSRYSAPPPRIESVPRIDLTNSADERYSNSRIRDDRSFVIEERKRPTGPIVSNIPEKIVRYETWSSDSRIERMSRSAREQHELMSRPVYSYSSHKRMEAFHSEHRGFTPPTTIREQQQHTYPEQRYHYNVDTAPPRPVPHDYFPYYHDRMPSSSRHIIQKIPSSRDIKSHSIVEPHGSVPADKRVLSILRNSLETKQTNHVESKGPKQVPDLIVIDDADDEIEITDLTKDNDEITSKEVTKLSPGQITPDMGRHIHMPKAIDSLVRVSEYAKIDNDSKNRSPENDVASRIRTKAELKVLPPSQELTIPNDIRNADTDEVKLVPKSQKQHLFNQIRKDNLRFESVIKTEPGSMITEIKTEPMNIYEIEKDAEDSLKPEDVNPTNENNIEINKPVADDWDWANTCDSFLEQLKTGCHKKKARKKITDIADSNQNDEDADSLNNETLKKINKSQSLDKTNSTNVLTTMPMPGIIIKQEPAEDIANLVEPIAAEELGAMDPPIEKSKEDFEPNKAVDKSVSKSVSNKKNKNRSDKNSLQNTIRNKLNSRNKVRKEEILKSKNQNLKQNESTVESKLRENGESIKRICKEIKNSKSKVVEMKTKEIEEPIKTVIKEELESTDDDEPLINSKILKEKEKTEKMNYQLLRDLSEKSVYVKLECCDVDMNKNNRKSIDTSLSLTTKEREDRLPKGKLTRQSSRSKGKTPTTENKSIKKEESSTECEDEDISLVPRLRQRKNTKTDDKKSNHTGKTNKSPSKKADHSNCSTPIRKPGFGDGSDFHPGWEEELYRYKRSLRMPTRLIAIPRGSGRPFGKGKGTFFTRGSTSLPDLDPAPLSPAPSSAPSAATDDIFARRQDKLALDSDLESNSSYSAPNRLHYDSEASSSTVFSNSFKKKSSSIVDVLIKKVGNKDDPKKKLREKDTLLKSKIIPKKSDVSELLPTPSLGLVKSDNQSNHSAKKDKLMGDIFYLGSFRKETVTNFRNEFIKTTDGLLGAPEEFSSIVLKTRTRTESRVLKQRATIKEVFGDDRPASAPPSTCIEEDEQNDDSLEEIIEIKKTKENDVKMKTKPKKVLKEKFTRRSSSIRDGLRSTKSLKRNDAKGRLMRLKKRNNLMVALANKRIRSIPCNKLKQDKNTTPDSNDKDRPKEETPSGTNEVIKKRFKRLFGRRKFSSGFDYIRKKKKIIRRDGEILKGRRPIAKPSPETVDDIQKEVKGWFINKSVGETHLHRAARLGYTDCVVYCLDNMDSDCSAKDNAGFTPLHVAAAKGYVKIGRLLLQYGANVSAAAQGGIRPLHEACENNHVEMIRLLLSYGADPLLGTYAGQTPEEVAEGVSAALLRLHIADVQGLSVDPWVFPSPAEIIDLDELGCDPLASPPPLTTPPPADTTMELQCTEAPLPPFYSLKPAPGQQSEGLWCLLQDLTHLLQIKSKDSLLKQIHCGSGSPKELLREIRTQEFLERAQCHQFLCSGEKVNVRASKVALVRVTDKLRQLLKIETVLIS